MKIIVLSGSFNQKGSTNLLADYFMRGAREAGHVVGMIDTTRIAVRPCVGCMRCGYNGPCAISDDMEKIKGHILSADMIVFATPIYYYNMTAQLKTVIDRFCSITVPLQKKNMKSALIAVAWNTEDRVFEPLVSNYRAIAQYMHFADKGMILGKGCGTPENTAKSQYVRDAYNLGGSLKN